MIENIEYNKKYNKKLEAELIEQFSYYDLWSLESLEHRLKNVIAKAKERRLNELNKVHLSYECVTDTLRMEDLLLEDTFPCDLKYIGWTCTNMDESFLRVTPVVIPTDKKVMRMLFNRYLSKKEREGNVYEIERIMLWYVDNMIDIEPMDDDDKDLPRRLCTLLMNVMANWIEPLYWSLYRVEVGNFPKELWVGYNDEKGKLCYSGSEQPKYLPIWKNIKVTHNEQ